MKKSLLVFFLALFAIQGMAQERTVTGTVTDADADAPLPGVSILIKGTNTGTITDIDGQYSISVPDAQSVLVFSYLGYASQERLVGNNTEINVSLSSELEALSEVVVTAFGLEREKKALTYTVQDVSTQELSEARELNVMNSLSGKVAGLSINRSGSGVGGGTRVVLRGNRSISGDSQPLYIVDGVPADGIENLNPDDIESINVLKGPNAAALYGSRANNGAIVVNTKRGREGGFQVSVNTSYMFDQPLILANFQNIYGQGSNGNYAPGSEFSWGPRMDGSSVAHWSPDPNRPQDTYSFSPQPDNISDFYQTGHTLATTLAISGGNERNQTYFSYTYTDAAGVVPGNELGRHSINLRLTNKLSEKLTLDSKVNYIRQDIDNQLAQGENFSNPNRHIMRMPRNITTEDFARFEYINSAGLLRQNYFNPGSNGGANPYWTVNRNLRKNTADRVVAFSSLSYQMAEGLTILARAALDRSFGTSEEKLYNDSYIIAQNGRFSVGQSEDMEINTDFLISYEKSLSDDWYFNINAGGNSRINRNSSLSSNTGQNMVVPNFFALSNTQQVVSNHGVGSPKDVNSLYSFAQIAWKNAIFLDITARNDWSSTLPKDNWSFFYPSVGLNAVVSDLVEFPEWFTFAKVRGSFAEVGNDTSPYQLQRTAAFAAGGLGGYLSLSTTLPNENLLPETTQSIELGGDFRFVNNRLGLDFTYYKTNSFNQLFTVALPVGSGASSFFTNGGDVQNEGIEVILNLTPIRRAGFNWNITANFARNISMVNEINDQRPSIVVGGDFLRQFRVEEGKPFGEVYSRGYLRDDQGRVIVGDNGVPRTTPGFTVRVANYNPIWLGGIQNSFNYKNFRANFTIDFRQGGSIASLTNAIIYADGMTEETLQGRDGGLVFGENFMEHETAVRETEDGTFVPNDIETTAELFWVNMGGRNAPIGEVFSYSATNVRMREAVIGYTIPAAKLERLPLNSVTVNFVARNLFFFLNEAKNIDPDVTVGTSAAAQGFDSFGPPTARSFGFNVSLGF
ncbi:SusC/RagA family TonB-linked outer membrane protein [Cyclobacterium jeungdonense]|uniref:SusC/RagA family TonB-linked outer membrane protein n=1 Tax=Cyclobacterium jeungdonense TaxID=708087 RepID=A0ABT8C638_9BACT|nr:SusC/RagA family TonB-linked outer membrane protein [Cyclobacterium jeungdonense]MDN3687786.1 SusC/RagA family TonB-linked outer membrane protein [Cyclobacterium jeungdonense]